MVTKIIKFLLYKFLSCVSLTTNPKARGIQTTNILYTLISQTLCGSKCKTLNAPSIHHHPRHYSHCRNKPDVLLGCFIASFLQLHPWLQLKPHLHPGWSTLGQSIQLHLSHRAYQFKYTICAPVKTACNTEYQLSTIVKNTLVYELCC